MAPPRVTVKCEKQQASAIADYLRKVLSDLPRPADQAVYRRPWSWPSLWIRRSCSGPIGLGYDRDNDRVLVQLEEVVPVDEEGEPDPDAVEDRGHLRVFLTRGQAAAFCESHRFDRGCRPTAVPVVRQPDRSGRPHLPANELTGRAHQLHVLTVESSTSRGACRGAATQRSSSTCAVATMRAQAIYKPLRGERPLWDFEPGLHRRELAAYRLSEAMGLDLVPPTVLRDGPLGEGSVQWFVDADHRQHYFTIHEERRSTRHACVPSRCSISSPTTPTARVAMC